MVTLRAHKRLFWAVGLGLGVALAATFLHASGLLSALESRAWDWRVARFPSPDRVDSSIILVLIDQRSLDFFEEEEAIGWPWPRTLYGAVIEFCNQAGARAIVIDILYTENSVYGVSDDLEMAASLSNWQNVFLAVFMGERERDEGGIAIDPLLAQHALDVGSLAPAASPHMSGSVTGALTRIAPQRPSTDLPVEELLASATGVGNVAFAPDRDGVFRKVQILFRHKEHVFPSLALAAVLHLEGENLRLDRGAHLYLGEDRIPLDRDGNLIVKYHGGVGTYRTISMASVIQSFARMQRGETPTLQPEIFQDAVVFLGMSAPGLFDLRPTPLSPVYPGAELHATVMDNLVNRDFLRPAGWLSSLVFIFLPALLVSLGANRVGTASKNLGVLALVAAAVVLVAIGVFKVDVMLPMAAPMLAVVGSFMATSALKYATEGRQKRFIKNAFRHYLSPAVIDAILQNPERLRLGGERRELTIFFSDLAGFTSLSEGLEPHELAKLLNDYLSEMTDIILRSGGTLDKYEGDAIIAFWNAPLYQGDHAARAVRAALDCQRRLQEISPKLTPDTERRLRMRIGINTGEVVVGNLGSRERFDYTVLGDAANLASRLEGINKVFGTDILISEETMRQVGAAVETREIGFVRVVGKATPTRIFQPLGRAGETDEDIQAKRDEFGRALDAYYRGSWDEAVDRFSRLEDDPPAGAYVARCLGLKSEPPGEEWDGVWKMTTK